MSVQVAITASGRMSLPADVRKRLGLGAGGSVYLDETADGVILRTASQIVAHAQALARQYADEPGALVAEFLDGRVAESGERSRSSSTPPLYSRCFEESRAAGRWKARSPTRA